MRNVGAASLYLFIFVVVITLVIGLVPIPHYQPQTGWYPGPSFFSKMLGATDPGISADKVYKEFIIASVQSPMKLTCQTDLDCKNYKVLNQCRVYCGNSDDANNDAADQLSKNRVCDPAGWNVPKVDCRCLLGSCIDINN